jgi:hypothetical protein
MPYEQMTIYRLHYNSQHDRAQFISILIIEYVNLHNTVYNVIYRYTDVLD